MAKQDSFGSENCTFCSLCNMPIAEVDFCPDDRGGCDNFCPYYVEDFDVDDLYEGLKNSGDNFTDEEIESIIAAIECGASIDGAIQNELYHREN